MTSWTDTLKASKFVNLLYLDSTVGKVGELYSTLHRVEAHMLKLRHTNTYEDLAINYGMN